MKAVIGDSVELVQATYRTLHGKPERIALADAFSMVMHPERVEITSVVAAGVAALNLEPAAGRSIAPGVHIRGSIPRDVAIAELELAIEAVSFDGISLNTTVKVRPKQHEFEFLILFGAEFEGSRLPCPASLLFGEGGTAVTIAASMPADGTTLTATLISNGHERFAYLIKQCMTGQVPSPLLEAYGVDDDSLPI